MITGIEAQFVTLTTNIDFFIDDECHTYDGGEFGRIVAHEEGFILARFPGRPVLEVWPGDTCVIGRQVVA